MDVHPTKNGILIGIDPYPCTKLDHGLGHWLSFFADYETVQALCLLNALSLSPIVQ